MPRGRPITTARVDSAAGRRDKWVEIQRKVESVGRARESVVSWVSMGTVAMSRIDQSGDERLVNGTAISSFMNTKWTFPYRADMDPEIVDVPSQRRLVFGGRRYDIQMGAVVGRKESISLFTLAASRLEAT